MAYQKRLYSFKIVSYANYEEIQPLLDKAYHWVMIIHDQDEQDPHYHILATFKANRSFDSVRKLVVSEQNTFVQELADWTGDFEYLTHSNDPKKHQYLPEELISDDIEFWQRKAKEFQKGEDDFVHDLLDCSLTFREMAIKYGRDYIRNFRHYEYFKECVYAQERKDYET